MTKTKTLTLASLLLAIAIILPQAFHSIPNMGTIILPMHIPVYIAGFLCGPIYGLIVGVLSPILSHLLFAMPPTHMLSQMFVELACYGFMTGLLNKLIIVNNNTIKTYIILIIAMLFGRVMYGLLNALILQIDNYSLSIWLTSAFVTGLPGIIIQLLIIPLLISSVKKMM